MIKMNNWGQEAKEILNQTVLNTGLTCEQILPTTYIPLKASQELGPGAELVHIKSNCCHLSLWGLTLTRLCSIHGINHLNRHQFWLI